MKVQSLSIDCNGLLSLWEHFISKYSTKFGEFPRMKCAALEFYNTTDNQEIEKWLKSC